MEDDAAFELRVGPIHFDTLHENALAEQARLDLPSFEQTSWWRMLDLVRYCPAGNRDPGVRLERRDDFLARSFLSRLCAAGGITDVAFFGMLGD